MRKGYKKNCESPFEIFGTHLVAPNMRQIYTPDTSHAGIPDNMAAGLRNAMTIQTPGGNQAGMLDHANLIPSEVNPKVGETLVVPGWSHTDFEPDECRYLQLHMTKAAMVPSSYPYKYPGTSPPDPSSAESCCPSWSVDLLPGYGVSVRRFGPEGGYYTGEGFEYLDINVDALFVALRSRVARVDGQQRIVTYVFGAGDGGAPYNGSPVAPVPERTGPLAREPDETDAYYLAQSMHVVLEGSSPMILVVVDIESQTVLRRIQTGRLCNFGGGEWNRTDFPDRMLVFEGGQTTPDGYVASKFRREFWNANGLAITISGVANQCFGIDDYLISSYEPNLTSKGTDVWCVSKMHYDDIDAEEPVYTSAGVGLPVCDGDWLIVLPSHKEYRLTDPPAAKDLSEWSLTAPSERLPDVNWVIAFNKARTRVVTGRALNTVYRTGGVYDSAPNDKWWDGTLQEDEIENVLLWDEIPPAEAAKAGLPDDYEITDISIRAYQHINGKDYAILGVPPPPLLKTVEFSFDAYKPYFASSSKEDPDSECDVFRGREGTYDFNKDQLSGVSTADEIGISWVPKSPDAAVASGAQHFFSTEFICNPRSDGAPVYPYNSGRGYGSGAADLDFDEGKLRLYYGDPETDDCSINPMDFPITMDRPENRDLGLVLTNLFNNIETDEDAVITLQLDLAAGAHIAFDWRFENRMWEFHPGSGTYNLTQFGTPDSWLEVKLNGSPIIGRWSHLDGLAEVFPFHVDHSSGSSTPSPVYADSSVVTFGTETGAYTDTATDDGTYNSIEDDSGDIEVYYEFVDAEDAIQVQFTGYLSGSDNELQVYAWKWASSSWDEIGTLLGQSGTDDVGRKWTINQSDHIGPSGPDEFKVRIRFKRSDIVAGTLNVDQIYVSANTVPDWDQPGVPETQDHWRRFVKNDFSEFGGSAGTFELEIRVHCGVAAPVEVGGVPIGRALIKNVNISKVIVKTPADEYVPFYYDGDQLRYLKYKSWAWSDEGPFDSKPATSRTARNPDCIVVRDPTDITQDNPDRKILYGNEFYIAQVMQDGSLDRQFYNMKDKRTIEDSETGSGTFQAKAGFVRWTASPEQQAQIKACDDDGNPYMQPGGDTFFDVGWGVFDIIPAGCSIQIRGAHGAWRDATWLNLQPVKIDPDEPPVIDGKETQGILNEPGWEDHQWIVQMRPHPDGNAGVYGPTTGWSMRVHGWTIKDEGRTMIPHADIIWAPWRHAPAFPDPGPYDYGTKYPPEDVWQFMKPRSPRNSEFVPDEVEENTYNKPLTFTAYNYIVPREYSSAYSRTPQFVWVKLPEFVPNEEWRIIWSIEEYAYPQWTLVPAWHSPNYIRFPNLPEIVIAPKDKNTWTTWYTSTIWKETNTCGTDEEGNPVAEGTIRRTTIIRPVAGADDQFVAMHGPFLTDFDAVDCKCCCH